MGRLCRTRQGAHRATSPSAGRTEYLNGLHFSWGSDDLGRGPTGTAIRSQSVQVLKDTHRSKKFRWRAAADKHGLRTVCALPLVLGDDVIGVLNIYSGEPGTFGPNEVAVLSRLADDLAYGIGRLRDSDCLTRNEALLRRRSTSPMWAIGSGISTAASSRSWPMRYSRSTESPTQALKAR